MTRADARGEVEEILALVKERVRLRREQGTYDAEVERILKMPLPGGPPLLKDELKDPIAGLREVLATAYVYDARSRRRYLGPFITIARRSLMWLLRWWIQGIQDRQDRINRLVLKALEDLTAQPSPRFGERLAALERAEMRYKGDEQAAQLALQPFAERFSGHPDVIRKQAEPFVPLFKGCRRVLDLGSGRGTFLELMRDEGVGAYGVDLDREMVELCRGKGLEAVTADAEDHLRGLPERSIDGVFSAHVAEHVEPGKLVEILRQCRRVMKRHSAIVMATPNPRTLTVGAHTFWLDPSHRRPIPPDLFHFYLENEGFVDVEVKTYARAESRLSEDVPAGSIRENVRLLNETLFGDRDYAVTGRAP